MESPLLIRNEMIEIKTSNLNAAQDSNKNLKKNDANHNENYERSAVFDQFVS